LSLSESLLARKTRFCDIGSAFLVGFALLFLDLPLRLFYFDVLTMLLDYSAFGFCSSLVSRKELVITLVGFLVFMIRKNQNICMYDFSHYFFTDEKLASVDEK
jgi:hypothetical protein